MFHRGFTLSYWKASITQAGYPEIFSRGVGYWTNGGCHDLPYFYPVRQGHRNRVLCQRVCRTKIRLFHKNPYSPKLCFQRLLGNPKEKESLTGLLLNTRVVQLKLGRIDVRFQKPFSLKAYLAEQKSRRASDAKLEPKAEQAVLLKALGYEILSGINQVAVVMPAALVGSVMLTIRGRGVGRSELIKRVGWLRGAIEARGGRVAEFAGMEIEQVVDRALIVLKDLIGEHKDLIEVSQRGAVLCVT